MHQVVLYTIWTKATAMTFVIFTCHKFEIFQQMITEDFMQDLNACEELYMEQNIQIF